MANEKQTKLSVMMTEDYRLTSDGTQFIVQERKLVDPTKAPNWGALKARGVDPTIREEWKDIGYFSMNPKGIGAAFNFVLAKTAAVSDAQNLREFSAIIRETSERITDALEAQITRSDLTGAGEKEEAK